MKRFLFLIGVALCLSTVKAGIYNNSGTTAEDSICFVFKYLDSLGNPVAAAANDSVYIAVNYPGGIEAFRDSMVYNNAKITASTWEDLAGGESYTLRYAVADIDGTPVEGTYNVTVTANDNSLTLNSSWSSEFQLYTTGNFSTTLDSIGIAALTSLYALDSLADVLDSLESISVALKAARDSLQFLVTATGFSTLTTSDNIGINWADVSNPTTAVNLSATNIDVDQVVASVSGAVGSVAGNVDGSTASVTGAVGSVTGAVGSVTGAVGSVTGLTKELIASETWTISGSDDSVYAAGTMGKESELWDATGASAGVDSTVLSNMLKRVIFGIAVGSGADSTTLAQRKVLTEDMANTVEASIYAEFISGSNEDAFKANVSALALEASLFDPATDSVIVDVSAANTAGGLIPLTEDAVYANRADYKADVSGVSTYDPATDSTLMANRGEVAQENADSAYAKFTDGSNEDAFKANVSALAQEASLFDPATDSVIVDVSAANTAGGLIPLTEDAVYANRADYKADVSALALEATVSTVQASINTALDSIYRMLDSVYVINGLTTEMQADVDSLILFEGYGNSTRSIMGPGATTDTMHVYNGVTRLLRVLYWHVGGATGDAPDSTTVLDN